MTAGIAAPGRFPGKPLDPPAGRPLRALALLLLLAMVWLAARLPGLERRFLAALATGTAPGGKGRPHPRVMGPDSSGGGASPGPQSIAVADAGSGRHATQRLARPPSEALRTAAPLPPVLRLPAPLPVDVPPVTRPLPPGVPPAQVPAASGFDLATRAYAALAAGDRREAARLFGAARAAAGPDAAPQAATWQREQRRLGRHWSGDAYSLRRDAGGEPGTGGAAASPVLGGGQSGGTLAYTLDPLAVQPVAVIGRAYAAHAPGGGIDGATAQAAVGLRWQVTPAISLAAERLVALGRGSAGDWNLRVAGGGQVRRGQVTADGYGEAGVRGNGDAYAGVQARAMADIGRARRLVFTAGPGAWGSIQHAQTTVGRLDLGAGVEMRAPLGVTVSADWRWRVAGNAAPGSGPAVTVSAAF